MARTLALPSVFGQKLSRETIPPFPALLVMDMPRPFPQVSRCDFRKCPPSSCSFYDMLSTSSGRSAKGNSHKETQHSVDKHCVITPIQPLPIHEHVYWRFPTRQKNGGERLPHRGDPWRQVPLSPSRGRSSPAQHSV